MEGLEHHVVSVSRTETTDLRGIYRSDLFPKQPLLLWLMLVNIFQLLRFPALLPELLLLKVLAVTANYQVPDNIEK